MRAMAIVGLVGALAAAGLDLCSTSDTADDRPLREWEFGEYVGAGLDEITLDGAIQLGGRLSERSDFGPAAFDSAPVDNIATGHSFSSEDGETIGVASQAPIGNVDDPASRIGSTTRLVQSQSYRKERDDAALQFVVSGTFFDALDLNGNLLGSECAAAERGQCAGVIEGELFVHAEAYSATDHFFSVAGGAKLHGWQDNWGFEAWTHRFSRSPFWSTFDFDIDLEHEGGSRAVADLTTPLVFDVDLSSVAVDEQFVLRTNILARVYDRRGRESFIALSFRDPLNLEPGTTVRTQGLERTEEPEMPRPEIEPTPPPLCGAAPDPAAGTLQFSDTTYAVGEWAGASPQVLVTRVGGDVGAVRATVTTSAGDASPGTDYTDVATTVDFADGDRSPRIVQIPILQNDVAEPDKAVTVTLSEAQCARLGAPVRAVLTILDDDRL